MLLNKTAKIGIGWGFVVSAGIYGFYLSKENITKKRYEHMKVRERMRQANFGEYEPSPRKFD